MFKKRDLRILESMAMLQAVKENSGKRKAAQKLCVSMDTLNRYLSNLEMELGTKLLFIKNQRSALTATGEEVVKIAEQIQSCLKNVYDIKLSN